jgi:hypothetical protein
LKIFLALSVYTVYCLSHENRKTDKRAIPGRPHPRDARSTMPPLEVSAHGARDDSRGVVSTPRRADGGSVRGVDKEGKDMKTKKILAWHWTNGMKLRDGQPLKVGKLYTHTGKLEMCAIGYHASTDIRDALSYAPGFTVSRVECSGEMIIGNDKLVCTRRKAIWSFDAKKVVLAWSIRVATDAVKSAKKICHDPTWNIWADLWISGKNRTADAAYVAARVAARAAAYAAARAADAADAADAARAAAYAAAYAAAKKKYSSWLVIMIQKARKA